jgi:hypothetical protein
MSWSLGAALCVGLVGCGGEPPVGPTPIPPTGGTPPSGGTRVQGIGCYLQGAAAGSPTSIPAILASGMIFTYSGNLQLDSFNQQEGLNLVGTYQLSPRMFYLNDQSSPNAFATPEIANPYGPDGTILFGLTMMSKQLGKDPSGATVVAIMAHEFSHLAQFRRGYREAGKRPELHADFMAGWYMKLRGQYAWTNLSGALQVFFEVGDYEFNSRSHHGTPQERLAAAQAGFNSGATSAAQAYDRGWQYLQ